MKKGIPKFNFSEGFFPLLGAMVSGSKEFPLDTATSAYCCLLSAAMWDFDEGLVFVDMAELELRFCKKDAEEMATMLVQRGWAEHSDDWLILARIENGRMVLPFKKSARKSTPSASDTVSTSKRQKGSTSNNMVNKFKVEPKGWYNDSVFDDTRIWIEDRHKAWAGYLETRKKTALSDATSLKVREALTTAYEKRLTNMKFMDYFYGICAMYFEWTDAPSRPPAKDFQAATTLVKNTDHWTLVQLVPFWLENCEKIKKGLTGDSVATFGYFYNQLLTLRSKAHNEAKPTTSRRYGTVVKV